MPVTKAISEAWFFYTDNPLLWWDHSREKRGAVLLVRDVSDCDGCRPSLFLDPCRRLLGRGTIAICADDRRPLSSCEHCDRPTVSDRRVRVIRRLRAGADDQHAPPGETLTSHRSNPGTPGSRCTPSELKVNATKW